MSTCIGTNRLIPNQNWRQNYGGIRPLVKSMTTKKKFLITQPKYMLCNVGTQKNSLKEMVLLRT